MRSSRVGILLCGVLFTLGCAGVSVAPVRTTLFPALPVGRSTVAAAADRFGDTVVMTPADLAPGGVEALYGYALELFRQERYARACSLFEQIARTPSASDSLSAEALFLAAECRAALGELSAARDLYDRLLQRDPPWAVLQERLLLRLGHVLCAQGLEQHAAVYFARLRHQFPRSRYLPLAHCGAVTPLSPKGPAALPKFVPQ